MNNRNNDKQGGFLLEVIKSKIVVNVFLVNGIKLKGLIEDFDINVVILKNPDYDILQMVYKHAIATILAAPMEKGNDKI
jgi:host factor-I protein